MTNDEKGIIAMIEEDIKKLIETIKKDFKL